MIKSHLMRWYLVHWFDKHGVTLEVEQLTLNVYNSNFELDHFVATNASGRRLSVDGLSVNWQWKPLWDRQVIIDEVTVNTLKLDVVGKMFKPLHIGPLDLALLVSEVVEDKPTDEPSAPWLVNIGPIKLTDFDVCYRDEKVQYADVGLPLKDANKPLDNCLKWQTLDLDTRLSLSATGGLTLQGNVGLTAVEIKDWLTLGNLTVDGLDLSQQRLDWTALQLDLVEVFGHEGVSDSHLSLAALNVAQVGIELNNMAADINQLKLSGLAVSNQDSRLAFDHLIVDSLRGDINNVELSGLSIDKINGGFQDSDEQIDKLSTKSLAVSDVGKKLNGEGFELQNVRGTFEAFIGRAGRLVVENFAGNLAEQVNVGAIKIDEVIVQQRGHDLAKWDSFSISTVVVDIAKQQAALQSLGLTGVNVWQKAKDEQHHKAASFDALGIESVLLGMQSQQTSLQVKGLELTGLALLENFGEASEVHPSLVTLKTLNVDNIQLAESIDVGKVSLNGFDSLLVVHPDDGLNIAKWLYSAPDKNDQQDDK
ncbi:MAG: AsmA family protein, partial [Psychrosphaera sp.]|nr:AsmA family protein [Psychrosphaera sp.]